MQPIIRSGAKLLCALAVAASAQAAIAAEDNNATKCDANSVVKDSCKISCVDPHACCIESQKVLDVLEKLVKSYSSGDLKTYEAYLDDQCTTFDESSHKLISGKANVLEDLKTKFARYSPEGPTPLLSFTIDHPYAKVSGDTAVVTFVAYREIGGKHPYKEKSNITDVFIKHGNDWKKLHYRGAWKKTSA